MKSHFTHPLKLLSGIILQAALLLTMADSLIYIVQIRQQAELSIAITDATDKSEQSQSPLPPNDSEEQNDTYATNFSTEYLQEDPEQLVNNAARPLKHNNSLFADKFASFDLESFSPPPECINGSLYENHYS